MSKFKAGDKVAIYLTAEIQNTKGHFFNFPIEAKDSGGKYWFFTKQGKRKQQEPVVLFTEQELELQFIAKFALRLMPSGKYIAQSSDGWFLVYEQKPNLPDDAGYWQSDFPSVYVCRTEPAANPTKQLFKISDILTND